MPSRTAARRYRSPPWVKTEVWHPVGHFRSTPINGHRQTGPVGPFRANSRHHPWHPVKACLALPSDPSYSVLWVGLRAMAQERPVRVERRLSAILAADVAGYSRLMHHDEEATHAKLTALLADAVEPEYRGARWPHREEHRRRVLGGVSECGPSGSGCCAVSDPHQGTYNR